MCQLFVHFTSSIFENFGDLIGATRTYDSEFPPCLAQAGKTRSDSKLFSHPLFIENLDYIR